MVMPLLLLKAAADWGGQLMKALATMASTLIQM